MADFGSLSAAQINAGMGFGPGGVGDQSQAALNSNFGNFGQQTDYYSGLGAAYGRATGGFNGAPDLGPMNPIYGGGGSSVFDTGAAAYNPYSAPAYNPFAQYGNGGYNPYDPGTYAPSAQGNVGSQSSAQAAALRSNFLANGGDPSVFNDRWGGMPSTYTPDYGNLQNIPQGIFNGNFLRQQPQQPMFDYFSPQTFAPSAQPNIGARTPTAPAMGSLFDQGSYQQGPPPVTDQQRQQGIDMLLRMNNPNTGVGSG